MRGLFKLGLALLLTLSLASCKEGSSIEELHPYERSVEMNDFDLIDKLNELRGTRKESSYTFKMIMNESVKTESYVKNRILETREESSNKTWTATIDFENKLIEDDSVSRRESSINGAFERASNSETKTDSYFYQHHGERYYAIDKQTYIAYASTSFEAVSSKYKSFNNVSLVIRPDYFYYIDDNYFTIVIKYTGDTVGSDIIQLALLDDEFIFHTKTNKVVTSEIEGNKVVTTIASERISKMCFKDVSLKMYDMRKFKMI